MAQLITLDWGTTSLRAYLLDASGAVLARREGGPGIMKVENGAFEAALTAFCGDWLSTHPEAALIASGMIGSKQGWIEAHYCPCPAGRADLAAHLIHVPLKDGRQLAIVPGVSYLDPHTGVPDVMRGEETQLVGAMPASGRHVAVLPGTHSKWAWMVDGAITTFASFMTGEVYAALCGHTILGRLMNLSAPHDTQAFARGVGYGLEAPAQLLNRIFSARTLGLFDQVSADGLPSYLSGVLIGAEIGGALAIDSHIDTVTIIGSATLAAHYAAACSSAGFTVNRGADDAACMGLHAIQASRSQQ